MAYQIIFKWIIYEYIVLDVPLSCLGDGCHGALFFCAYINTHTHDYICIFTYPLVNQYNYGKSPNRKLLVGQGQASLLLKPFEQLQESDF